MKTHHYIVSGMVQGVFFRYYTKKTADKLSIKGTVRNLFNGDVEVYAQGETANLESFENFLGQGSPSAEVKNLIKKVVDSEGEFPDFKIVY